MIGKQQMIGAIDAVCDVAQRIIGKLQEGAAPGGPPLLGAAIARRREITPANAGDETNAVAPALKRAAKEGIHVISYDSGVATDARQIFVNQVKGESLAEMMLISMHDLIGGEGEFAILSSTATATNQNAWIDFMKAKMASEPKFAKMKLVQVAYGEESEQVNQQQVLVQAFPNLKGIIVPAGIGLPAAAPPSSRLARSPK